MAVTWGLTHVDCLREPDEPDTTEKQSVRRLGSSSVHVSFLYIPHATGPARLGMWVRIPMPASEKENLGSRPLETPLLRSPHAASDCNVACTALDDAACMRSLTIQ